MGSNLLAKRLAEMAQAGLLVHGKASAPYSLTAKGRALEPVVLHLARWGLDWLAPDPAALHIADWDLLALKALFSPDSRLKAPLIARFNEGDWVAWVRIDRDGFAHGLGEPDTAPDIDFPCLVAGLRQAEAVIRKLPPRQVPAARRFAAQFAAVPGP